MSISNRVRLYELSRELDLDTKDVIAVCEQLSIVVKSHSSTITESEAELVRAKAPQAYPKTSDKKTSEPKAGDPKTGDPKASEKKVAAVAKTKESEARIASSKSLQLVSPLSASILLLPPIT
jgi:translation initiation factor IF-2